MKRITFAAAMVALSMTLGTGSVIGGVFAANHFGHTDVNISYAENDDQLDELTLDQSRESANAAKAAAQREASNKALAKASADRKVAEESAKKASAETAAAKTELAKLTAEKKAADEAAAKAAKA